MGELHDDLAWYAARATSLNTLLSDTLYERLPHLTIHGDMHSDNLRFAGDHVFWDDYQRQPSYGYTCILRRLVH